MFFLIEFIFYFIFFFIKLYLYLDKKYLFSDNGSKLKKHLEDLSIEKLDDDFNIHQKSKQNHLNKKEKSVEKVNKIKYTTVFFISIFILKFSFSYNFFQTNFIYFNFFGKYIDLVSTFSDYIKEFKTIYYLLVSFFLLNVIWLIVSKVIDDNTKTNKDKELKYIDIDNIVNINIGKDKKENNVYINEKGLYQNLLITGSIGSGKTSSAISNILDGLISNNIYGLIIDVKGNYIDTVEKIAKNKGKESKILKISMDSDFKYNPLYKSYLTSIELANRVRKVLQLLSKENLSDSFWLDKAEVYIQDFITIIRAYSEIVDFSKLHKLVIDKAYLEQKINIIKNKILENKFSEEELFCINSAINNIKKEFLTLDDRTLNIIKAEITRVTNIFVSNKKIYDKFCGKSDKLDFNEENIVVLSINIGENEKLAKLIATYLKLDFQKQILSNKKNCKPIFFICDEYQEFANLEDSHFFSLSREYKCINIISMQSYSSLINTLKNKTTALVIIQNLVNKIWFRNDDIVTVEQVIKQVGKKINKTKSLNFGESGQNSKYNFFSKNFKEHKSSLSQSYSISEKLEYIINEEYLTQELKTFEAICLISDGNKIKLKEKIKMVRWGDVEDENKNI